MKHIFKFLILFVLDVCSCDKKNCVNASDKDYDGISLPHSEQ